jgi:hypothetical protein
MGIHDYLILMLNTTVFHFLTFHVVPFIPFLELSTAFYLFLSMKFKLSYVSSISKRNNVV